MVPVLHQYLWIVVTGAIGAFGFGWGTGANDVANAFGTSVGAKTLTMKQAVLIAAIFEFIGALVLGRVSTSVIAGKIANPAAFRRQPELYAYGMSCTLFVGTVWLAIASYLGYNVSSTHTIIGGIIGFAMVAGGKDAVNWAVKDPSGATFPPYTGVLPIVLSWFISPILTSLGAALIFFLVRTLVLRRANGKNLALWLLPPFVLLTVWINVYFVFTKGAKKTLVAHSDWSDKKAGWIALVVAAGVSLLSGVIVVPLLKRRADKHFKEMEARANAPQDSMEAGDVKVKAGLEVEEEQPKSFVQRSFVATRNALMRGMEYDIHQVVETDPTIAALHERAEKFDPQVEFVFGYLQVFSAICVIFAHGAGEVGYMAGPLGAIWDIYNKGYLPKSVQPPVWIILIGAIGLVVGLATYGYNVTQAMGTMLSKLTPSRGFAAELATSMVIMIAAQYGLPTSSSQCITGGIIGVGFLEGIVGVNWKFFAGQFASWVLTLAVVGLSVAGLFAQGVYAPNKVDGDHVTYYENKMVAMTNTLYSNFNKTLFEYRAAANTTGRLPNFNLTQWKALNDTVAKASAANKKQTSTSSTAVQTLNPVAVTKILENAMKLYNNYTIFTLGQTEVFAGAKLCNNNATSGNVTKVACPAVKLA